MIQARNPMKAEYLLLINLSWHGFIGMQCLKTLVFRYCTPCLFAVSLHRKNQTNDENKYNDDSH